MEIAPTTPESNENRIFTYKNNSAENSKNIGEVIFECETSDILKADELFKQKIGKSPASDPLISVVIEKIEKDDKML